MWNDNRNCHKQERIWPLVLYNLVQNYLALFISMSIYFRIVTECFVLCTSSVLDVIAVPVNGWRWDNARFGALLLFFFRAHFILPLLSWWQPATYLSVGETKDCKATVDITWIAVRVEIQENRRHIWYIGLASMTIANS